MGPGLAIVALPVLLVAVAMSMVGKGGGNFYVVILAAAGTPMHQAATTAQFMLLCAAAAAAAIFGRNKSICWPLTLLVGSSAALAALAGGFFSHYFSGFALKLLFAVLLVLAGAAMLLPRVEGRRRPAGHRPGRLALTCGGERYAVNLWIALPITGLAGFTSGMVGVSGGSYLVPLMALACGVPVHTAVGTASALVAATALMGFAGHAAQGDFDPASALPLAAVAVVGGLVGSKLSLRTRPGNLGRLFAYSNWLAALFMLLNALHTRGAG